jgi:hypothetical protein
LKEGTSILEFREILYSKIQVYKIKNNYYKTFNNYYLFLKKKYLNHTSNINKIINKLIDFGDVNRDEKLNLAEANNILAQLNNKYTFFQILFSGKAFASEIKQFCGRCVEIDQIINQVYIKKDCKYQIIVIYFFLFITFFNSIFRNRSKFMGKMA